MTERQKVIAFALGYLFKSNRLSFGVDDASKWITVHPNGKGPKKSGDGDKKGRRILIDEETGFIFGGIDSELFAETSAIRNRDYETYSKLKEIFPEYIKRYEAAYSEALDWSRQPN